jgi:phosphoserine aminotransferase
MALMICSPESIARTKAIGENLHYNSAPFMNDMMEKWQTPYTPNVLSIYLLMRVLEKSKSIKEVHRLTDARYKKWIAFIRKRNTLQHLVKNLHVHSLTVLPVISNNPDGLIKIKSDAKKKGFLLGEGYGDLKATTFRIANFPALKNSEITLLMKFLKRM